MILKYGTLALILSRFKLIVLIFIGRDIFNYGFLVDACAPTALGNNKSSASAPDLFDDFDVQQASNKELPVKAVKGKNRSIHVHTDLLWSDTLTLNLFDDGV